MKSLNNIVVFGATSAIAIEVARRFAGQGVKFFLVARNADKLNTIKQDLVARGSEVEVYVADMAASFDAKEILDKAVQFQDQIDLLFVAHGSLCDQEKCETDWAEFEREFQVNYLSIAKILMVATFKFKEQKSGAIAVISSVAGDRGRKGIYIYGSAKAALNVLLSGLRQKLLPYGVRVINIKPGFVDTPMTAEFKKGLLFASAPDVGKTIAENIMKGRDEFYVPWFWGLIMFVVRTIPEFIFKKLNF